MTLTHHRPFIASTLLAVTILAQSCTSTTAPATSTTTSTIASPTGIAVHIDATEDTVTGTAPIDTYLVTFAQAGRFDPAGLDITETQGADWHATLWQTLGTHPIPTYADITITNDTITLAGTVSNRCYTELADALNNNLPPTVQINLTAVEPPDPWAELEQTDNVTAHFATGSAEVTAQDRVAIEHLARILANLPGVKLAVVGHTDTRGDEHIALSQARADAVTSILIASGIPAVAISTIGKGDVEPADQGDTEHALRLNRRTEITVTQIPEQPPCGP